jgi:hypothetical protein
MMHVSANEKAVSLNLHRYIQVLAQLKKTAEDNLHNLINTRAGIENAIKNECMQLQRINFAVKKAQKAARYADADRVVRERQQRGDGGGGVWDWRQNTPGSSDKV